MIETITNDAARWSNSRMVDIPVLRSFLVRNEPPGCCWCPTNCRECVTLSCLFVAGGIAVFWG